MKFVHLPALPPARLCLLLRAATLFVKRAVLVMMGTSSVEIAACPSHSVVVFMKIATTVLDKCFIPVDSVKRNANALKMER